MGDSEWETGTGGLGVGDSEWETGTGGLGVGDSEWGTCTGGLGLGLCDVCAQAPPAPKQPSANVIVAVVGP